MQNIGEKLEEARKRNGISIREAAEATKIRGDFLLAFENNSMEIPLPEVYVRGFLINYCKYLKLDPKKIMIDYDAMQLGRGKRKDAPELLGYIEIPDKGSASEPSAVPEPESTVPDYRAQPARSLYYKVGIIFCAAFLLVFLIVLFVNLVISQKGPEINPDLRDSSSSVASETTSNPSAGILKEETITLIALDNVNVVVRQKIDNRQIFSGMLGKGETKSISKLGPVRISFLEGENLLVEKDGRKFKMGKSGPGTRSLD